MKEQIISEMEFIDYVENQNTKIAKRVWNWLQQDLIMETVLYGNVWWYVTSSFCSGMPKYVYDYLKRYMKKKYGAITLYERDLKLGMTL